MTKRVMFIGITRKGTDIKNIHFPLKYGKIYEVSEEVEEKVDVFYILKEVEGIFNSCLFESITLDNPD